jgi:hypothetical protein
MPKLVLLAADSVEYVYRWPQAAGPYGAADSYSVRFTQGADIRTHVVPGLADSFAIRKPAFGPTAYNFTIRVISLAGGVAGDTLTVSHSYVRPAPAPLFPEGAVLEVDSSKVVRP